MRRYCLSTGAARQPVRNPRKLGASEGIEAIGKTKTVAAGQETEGNSLADSALVVGRLVEAGSAARDQIRSECAPPSDTRFSPLAP